VPVHIAVALFLGTVLGVAAAFLRGLMDRTIESPADIEQDVGLTCLGMLPDIVEGARRGGYYGYYPAYGKPKRRRGKREPIQSPELVVHEHPTSGVAEAARAVRTNLIFMSPDKPYKMLLVTSAGPAEGKTTVACCIAVAMAQAGQRVALVDCDLRRPRIHRIFATGSTVGLTTGLLDMKPDEVIHDTAIPNLQVIPAGPIPPNPAELFHSERFKQFLAEIAGRFDRVILDSPPVAAVTDATILSTQTDATVLVVRAFSTRKELVRHASRSIADVGGRIAGTVLNAVQMRRSKYRYSYYYSRREERGGEKGASSTSAAADQAAARQDGARAS